MLKRTKKPKIVVAVERERERVIFSQIGFICYAKSNLWNVDYKTKISFLKFISVL